MQDFRREGNDLYIVMRIGLVEALCGFQMTVTHLDGRQLLIKYPPGKIIEPGKQEFSSCPLSELSSHIFYRNPSFARGVAGSSNTG